MDRGSMGFRNLGCFNQALLAKQLWCIISQLDSFVANILKEKYLRYWDIWSVRVKNLVSLLWKSLLGTRDLVDKGARWRVGDSKTIRIWEHRWLPTPRTYKV